MPRNVWPEDEVTEVDVVVERQPTLHDEVHAMRRDIAVARAEGIARGRALVNLFNFVVERLSTSFAPIRNPTPPPMQAVRLEALRPARKPHACSDPKRCEICQSKA